MVVIPKEKRAQRLSFSLGAPRRVLVFAFFSRFFLGLHSSGRQQLRVCYCTYVIQGASPPATLAWEGKTEHILWSGQRSMIDCRWLEFLPRAPPPWSRKQHGRHMLECTAYVPSYLVVVLAMYMSVSKFVTTEILSLGWRIATDIGCAGTGLSVSGTWKKVQISWLWLSKRIILRTIKRKRNKILVHGGSRQQLTSSCLLALRSM